MLAFLLILLLMILLFGALGIFLAKVFLLGLLLVLLVGLLGGITRNSWG